MASETTQNDFQFSIEREAAWGTAISTTPLGLPTEELEISIEPNSHRFARSRAVRGQHEDDSWQDLNAAIPTASTTVILNAELMSIMMTGLCQKSTDWAAAANVWTIDSLAAAATVPTPKADNSGYYYTLVRNSPVGSEDVRITSAVISNATLSLDPVDNDGLLMGAFEFIGKAYTRGGTYTVPASQSSIATPYKWSGVTAVTWDGDNVLNDFVSMEMSLTNGGKLQGDIPSGEAVFPKWEGSLTLRLHASSFSEGMKGEAHSNAVNDAKPFVISWGDNPADSAGELNITFQGLITSAESSYDEGEVIDFTIDGLFTDALNMVQFIFYL